MIRVKGAAALMAAMCVLPAFADELPPPPSVTMTGQGIVRAAPDLATLSIGVRSEADAADAALSQNSAQMRTLLAAIDQAGIPKPDVQTAAVTLEPRLVYPEGGQPPKVTGYVARNVVTVQVRDLTKLGPLLQGAVSAGSNELAGLAYDFADKQPLSDKARAAAVADAKRKAQGVAAAAGIRLGRVLSITEAEEGRGPMPRAMLADAKGAVPVEAGTQDVTAQVTVVWEIAP